MSAVSVNSTALPPIGIMVIGDGGVVADAVETAVRGATDVRIAATAQNLTQAVIRLKSEPVDVAVLDIGMPNLSIERTLQRLRDTAPALNVVLCASLTFRNVKNSMAALLAGAATFIPVPGKHHKENSPATFRRDLLEAIRGLAGNKRAARPGARVRPPARSVALSLRTHPPARPDVVAIGSSTGGPQALVAVMKSLPRGMKTPILITQHLPATFTAVFAQNIGAAAGRPCAEGRDGEEIQPGRIYIAPGGFHMLVEKKGSANVIRITSDPPENFCRPAVDPMFRAIAKTYGRNVLAVVLTGMGRDGAAGGKAIVEAGGTVIAQDEETSIVWGMPGAAAEAGICSKVLPLAEIAPAIARLAS